MDSSLDKALALINGQSPSEYEATQLTDADRAQIENAIDVLSLPVIGVSKSPIAGVFGRRR